MCIWEGTPTLPLTKPQNLKQNHKLKSPHPQKNRSEFFSNWHENLSSPLLVALLTVTIQAEQTSKLLFSDADAGEDRRALNQMFPGASLSDEYSKAYKPPRGLDARLS